MTGEEVAARLAIVSALRMLCLRLPHLPTPTELERLRRFHALVDQPPLATESDVEALAAGWSQWWRERRTGDIAEMSRRLDPALVESDRRLITLAIASRGERVGS